MKYVIINPGSDNFEDMCDQCEQGIVLENLRKNGGTLNYSKLTYNSNILILCLNDNIPIGFCSLVLNDEVGLYVYQIAVKKIYQKQGIGTRLIEITKHLSEDLGIKSSAHVMAYNKGSQKTFENCGYLKDEKNSSEEEYFYQYKVLTNKIGLEEKGLN